MKNDDKQSEYEKSKMSLVNRFGGEFITYGRQESGKGVMDNAIKFYSEFDGITISDLVNDGSLNEEMARFLSMCINSTSLVVCGKIRSGKNTLSNALVKSCEDTSKIICIQNKLDKIKVYSTDNEKLIEAQMLELNINTNKSLNIVMQLSPDLISYDEIVDPKDTDNYFKMAESGHRMISTSCANNSNDLIDRLIINQLCYDPNINVECATRRLFEAVKIVVCMDVLPDGSRKVVSVYALDSIEDERLETKQIYKYNNDNNSFSRVNPINKELSKYFYLAGYTKEDVEPFLS